MLITLVVGLYTGRIVIDKLGVEDYGVYAVVGGVMGTLFFVVSSLRSATHRFIIYGFGECNPAKLRRTFGNIMTTHLALAVIMVIAGETIGLWWVTNKLVIPDGRLTATIWAYQFSIAGVVIELINAPYNAVIVAHERMDVFAYISVLDVSLKLFIVYLIVVAPFDRLIFYTFLLLMVSLINLAIYISFDYKHFDETHILPTWDKKQFKEIFGYASWMAVGNVSNSFCDQGFNLLLNLFFGPVVNAARGIAVMIQGIVGNFGDNIQMAIKPQIIKSYAANDLKRMNSLVLTGSKLVFFVIFALALPVMLEIHQFLDWWLVEVPKWTTEFVIIILLISCINIIRTPLYQAVSATGDLKRYQVFNTIVLILFLPIAYLILRLYDVPPTVPFLVLLGFHTLNFAVTCEVGLKQVGISRLIFIKRVIIPVMSVGFIAPIIPLWIKHWLGDGLAAFFIVCFAAVICELATSYILGFTHEEKEFVTDKVKQYIAQRHHRHNNG